MKILTGILWLLLIPAFAVAEDVTLTWNHSGGADGFGLFDRNFEKPYNYDSPSWIGNNMEGTVTLPDDRESAVVARAFIDIYDLDGNLKPSWSDNSNEVVFTPKPPAPQNLFAQILIAMVRAIAYFFV